MATPIRFRRRSAGGAAGAPASLKTAEPAFNMADGKIYIGYGDDGGGNATSIKVIAQDNFVANVPGGGLTGQVLAKNSDNSGDLIWTTPTPGGGTYFASGDGIELAADTFSLNYTEIATGIGLSNYATNGALAGKADLSHTHDASAITSGVLDIARIPVLPGNKTVVSSGAISAITAPQEADIAEGTIVTTTDGQRWVYSGSGSKTLEASYVALADITPSWTVIEGKPTFAAIATSGDYADLVNAPALATVATTGAYGDLTGTPTLGTMAAQNANSVAITGGTIDGVTLDGGTF